LPKVFQYERVEKAAFEEVECLNCGNRFAPSEAAVDIGSLRFEYETLSRKLSARESSTLTIATFTAAGALIIFSLLLEPRVADWRMYVFGASFLFGGIVYRELTVFTIDRLQLVRIRQLERHRRLFPDRLPQIHPFWRFLRSLVFRGALVYPAVFFLRYMAYPVNPLLANMIIFLITILLPYPLIFSILESWMNHRM
jgi:hypothetical protein